MKHLLAAATFAALLAAAPASAQAVYGMTTGNIAGFAPGGNWRDSVVIYAEGPDSILLDKLVAPISGDTGPALSAGTTGGIAFDVSGGSANLSGLGGFTTDAVNPVPEPATWAMMLVGFGAIGGALRARRRATLRYA